MHDEWTFDYEHRIFAVPVVTLPIVEKAIEELEWVVERGARIILVRPAPVPGLRGPRSFALPEFDPFWRLVEEADVVVGMHASDSGYQRYLNEWEGIREGEFTPFRGVSGFAAIIGGQHREITDTVASAVGHGLCTRFPRLKIVPVENGSGWVRPLIEDMRGAYEFNPHVFEEDPVEVLRRNVFVHPFHEDDTPGLIDVIGVDNVLFGSDFPHPEGMADPISFVDELEGCSPDAVAKVMGGNLGRLMNVA
jgi:predicted TIM-barrel fold metal-dependent hydrolase